MEKAAHTTHCPFKGNASYWTLKVGEAVAENAVWSYEDPYDDAKPVKEYLSFYEWNPTEFLYAGEVDTLVTKHVGYSSKNVSIVDWRPVYGHQVS